MLAKKEPIWRPKLSLRGLNFEYPVYGYCLRFVGLCRGDVRRILLAV